MANVSKILQTVGKGIKSAANSKAGKAIGKGLNTIFTPVRKAHQAQGCKSIKDFHNGDLDSISDKYVLNSLGAVVTMAGTGIGSVVTSISSDKHFEDNIEKFEKQRLISSKLSDTAVGLLGGFILGGPIGSIIAGGVMAAIPKDIVLGKVEMWQAGKTIYTCNDVRAKHRAARKEARAEQKIDKETLKNIPKMTAGNSSFKPDTTDKIQTVDTTSVIADSANVTIDTVALSDTLKTKIDTVEVKDSAKVAVDTVALADTLKTKVDTVEIKDSAKVAVDTVGVADTLKTKVDTVGVKDTAKKEDVKPIKDAVIDNKSEEVKSEEKTNFWNGELNEISIESIKVNKGDCLWNIAKRELQKANEGKRITNAQIVKQVKEFGRLNPDLFGENPTYESLDFIREGATLKLSA